MNLLLIILFVTISIIEIIYACKIELKVKSNTNKPFKFEILIPSIKSESERVLFTYKNQQKKLMVNFNK